MAVNVLISVPYRRRAVDLSYGSPRTHFLLMYKRYSKTIRGLDRPRGFQKVEALRFKTIAT